MDNSNSKNKGLKIALGILVVLFLGTAFYTSKLYNDKKTTEAVLVREKDQVLADLNIMAEKYDNAIKENEIVNQDLIDARDRIQGLMDSLKISQNTVSSLWRYKKKFLALQKEMDVLMAENEKLKTENQLLATTLDSTQVQLAERTMFTDSLLVQNTELAKVMENAAILQTVGLKGFGVIERSSGKLVPTDRARRSDKIRICYTVAKNSLVGAGEKELYIQILDPNDNVLGSNGQMQFGSEVLNYSLVSKFNYENKNLNICEFVEPSYDKFDKGRYKVNVFNKNQLISSTEFTLK